VHAVFSDDAAPLLLAAGAGRVVTCDSVAHATNGISVAAALVEGARDLIARLDAR
jgi:ribose-phosphate pyrophosphokinase